MSNKNSTKYRVRKRMFLNRDLYMSAFIIAIVENTEDYKIDKNGGRQYGEIELSLSDCTDKISYHFSLNSAKGRRESLYKIRRLAKVINEFREAIEAEAKMIAEQEKSISNKTKTAKA